jgi:rRNA-processing protein FCF1
MRVLMDADCLIKLTKAGLKELVCQHDEISIPLAVKMEVVDAGKKKGHPDAELVEENMAKGLISLAKELTSSHPKGDPALIATFNRGRYRAIATDDAKLIRILRSAGIPYLLPALLIYSVYKRGLIDQATGKDWLNMLWAFVSEDEYTMTKLLLEGRS